MGPIRSRLAVELQGLRSGSPIVTQQGRKSGVIFQGDALRGMPSECGNDHWFARGPAKACPARHQWMRKVEYE